MSHLSGEKYVHIKHTLQAKTVQKVMDIWIMGSYFGQKLWFKGHLNLDGFVSYKYSF